PGADYSAERFVRRSRVDHRAEHRPGGDRDADADGHDDAGMAEREEEPGRQRPLAVGHELTGHVVDRGDVVGVERVPQSQGPRGNRDAKANTEFFIAKVRGHYREEEDCPAAGVQKKYYRGHDGEPGSLAGPKRAGPRLRN